MAIVRQKCNSCRAHSGSSKKWRIYYVILSKKECGLRVASSIEQYNCALILRVKMAVMWPQISSQSLKIEFPKFMRMKPDLILLITGPFSICQPRLHLTAQSRQAISVLKLHLYLRAPALSFCQSHLYLPYLSLFEVLHFHATSLFISTVDISRKLAICQC